jgi:hypothetical protein
LDASPFRSSRHMAYYRWWFPNSYTISSFSAPFFFCHIVAVKFICHLLCLTPLYTSIYRHRTKKLGLVGLVLMSSCCPARSSLLFVSDNLMPEFSPCHSQRVL